MRAYNLIDFLNDIAFALDKASNFSYNEGEAHKEACDIYQQFLLDEIRLTDDGFTLPLFGDGEYDWTPLGAQELANEYSISYWDE